MAIKLKVQEGQGTKLTVQDTSANLRLGDQVQVVQSTDYNDLENKPSINGVTLQGDKSITIGYDEAVSVGSAEVGEAVTGEPNYTPSGTVSGSVITSTETFMTGGAVTLTGSYSNYKLTLGATFTPTTTTKSIVTGIGNLAFTGNGVTLAAEIGE